MFSDKKLGLRQCDAARVVRVARWRMFKDQLPFSYAPMDWALGKDWNPDELGNDQLGDCGPAAAVNWLNFMADACGFEKRFTKDDALDLYRRLGYDGTPATDNGVVLLDMLREWYLNGVGGVKLDGFFAVGWMAEEHLSTAVSLCGPLIVGATLTISCQSTDTWTDEQGLDTREWGGHAFVYHAHSPGLGTSKTWGTAVYQTAGFRGKRWNECYLPICRALLPPTGLDFDRLISLAEQF